MSYGIAALSLIPCRAEPSDKAEMTNQLLFGEVYLVLEEQEKWVKIETAHDGYIAWIDRKQFTEIDSEAFENHKANKGFPRTAAALSSGLDEHGAPFSFPLSCALPFLHSGKIKIAHKALTAPAATETEFAFQPEKWARMYLNTPYLWGGRSEFGIDCSGFVQNVFNLCGIAMPRDAYQQADEGQTIDFVNEAQTGDLAYFDNVEGKITHVGIVLHETAHPEDKSSAAQIIHASGKVRIDTLDHQGIFDESSKTYTHKLRIIKRVQ